MINSLFLKNIQSHKSSKLNFSKGVNLIIGTSDAGKSVIIKAIKKLASNRPTGPALLSWFGKTSIITADFDGNKVSRIISSTKNSYKINDTEFKKVKSDVPVEVSDILNINQNINIQSQVDPFFLLSNMYSPGKVAEQFNEIVDLEIIDRSRRNIDSIEQREEKEKNKIEKEISDDSETLKTYDWINVTESKIKKAEKLETKINKLKNTLNFIIDSLNEISLLRNSIKEKQPLLLLGKKIEKALQLCDEIKNLKNEKADISKTLRSIRIAKSNIKKQKKYEKIDQKVKKALQLRSEINNFEKEKNSISKTIRSLKSSKKNLQDKKERLTLHENKFHENMPEICPLCENRR